MPACDLKSAIDGISVEIIDQENHLLLRKIRDTINIHNRQPEMNRDQGSNLSTVYGTILQPHQNEAANNSATTDEGTRMGSESFAKLSANCWC